jgi:hypothetical protein
VKHQRIEQRQANPAADQGEEQGQRADSAQVRPHGLRK